MAEGESDVSVPDLGEFRLGDWRVNQDEGTLALDGHCVRLEPRVMDLLVSLAAAPGKLVSKDDLLSQVWGGTFVEEGVLSQAVHTLRKALGDDARQPRYIQTIPKRGYRLIAQVEARTEAVETPPAEIENPSPIAPPDRRRLLVPQVSRRAKWQIFTLLAMAITAFWIISSRFQQPLRIVVLPFENRGTPIGDDAFLADGLADEIANDLGSIPSLQVVSPPARQTSKTVTEIGRQLKVNYVLHGTVQWGKDQSGRKRARVVPHLIRAGDGVQVWSSTFEEPVDSIFEVEEKLSREVMRQMGIILQPEQAQAIARPPTANPDAYYAYIRGLGLKNQPFYSEDHLLQAIPLFERAVKLDPDFAGAWAELSQTHSYLAFNNPSPERNELARNALEKAKKIDSEALEVRLAEAYYTYRCLDAYPTAEKQLRDILQAFPNNTEALKSLGLVLRRTGKLTEAIETFKRAMTLEPQEVRLRWWIGETYRAMRKYAEADDYLDQAVSMAPDQAVYWMEKAENLLAWTGDPKKVRALIAESPDPKGPAMAIVAFQLDLYQRDYKSALSRFTPETMKELAAELRGRIAVLSVVARERLGDHAGALALAEENRRILEARVAEFPDDSFCRAYLAVTFAQLGRRVEALGQADQAVRMAAGDPFSGPRVVEMHAMVDTILGRHREALAYIYQLMGQPYQASISEVDFRKNPVWESLR